MKNNIETQEYDRRWGNDSIKYGGAYAGYSPHILKFLTQWLGQNSQPGAQLLELGCGEGYFSAKMLDMGWDLTGLDLSPVAVERAGQRNPKGSFSEHNLSRELPFENERFDAVCAFEVLEHLFSPRFALQQACRVLKPGGKLIVSVPYHGLFKNICIALFAFERHYSPDHPHVRFYTKKSLTSLLKSTGFSIQGIAACGAKIGVMRDLIFKTNILIAASKQ